MPNSFGLTPRPIKPIRIFIIVLVSAFVGEFVVMTCLPIFLPSATNPFIEAAVDAFLLTIVLGWVVWFTTIRPMHLLSESRLAFLNRSLESQEAERNRMTRELHDGVGQLLTSLQLQLRAIEESTQDTEIKSRLQVCRRTGSDIHSELSDIMAGLSPTILQHSGLAKAVRRLAGDLALSSDRNIEVKLNDIDELSSDPTFDVAVYRIIQESLHNAVKHSEATRIRLTSQLQTNDLEIRIEDNGKGFKPSLVNSVNLTEFGMGLVGIRERAMGLGGAVEIQSSEHGTIVIGRFPTQFLRKRV
jgi:signal transduction histidine kinase